MPICNEMEKNDGIIWWFLQRFYEILLKKIKPIDNKLTSEDYANLTVFARSYLYSSNEETVEQMLATLCTVTTVEKGAKIVIANLPISEIMNFYHKNKSKYRSTLVRLIANYSSVGDEDMSKLIFGSGGFINEILVNFENRHVAVNGLLTISNLIIDLK